MPTVRVMFVGQGASLLPEDRFVNVFHFHDPVVGDPAAAILSCTNVLEDLLTAPVSGGNALSSFISPYVSRTATLIAYDMLMPKPRIPYPRSITLAAAVGGGYAEEAAIVLSTHGAPPITARRRGRMYFGPLSDSATCIAPGTTSLPARPSSASAAHVVQALTAFGAALILESGTIGMPWSIRSTVPDENYVQITGGHVDNALDTQRRRGPSPTARLTFGT